MQWTSIPSRAEFLNERICCSSSFDKNSHLHLYIVCGTNFFLMGQKLFLVLKKFKTRVKIATTLCLQCTIKLQVKNMASTLQWGRTVDKNLPPHMLSLLKDPSQPPSFSVPSKLLIFHGEVKSYCFTVSCVTEIVFNYLVNE